MSFTYHFQEEKLTNNKLYPQLVHYVPEGTALYCIDLWFYFQFKLILKKPRNSRYGDYRYEPHTKVHTITVNKDLNPYAFLITYLHEVAHLIAMKEHGSRIKPHGEEWKSYFKRLSNPVLSDIYFPTDVLSALSKYLRNPKASSCSDLNLMRTLARYDVLEDGVLLASVPVGNMFVFQNEKYIYIDKKRTRALCRRISDQNVYLISLVAKVLIVG